MTVDGKTFQGSGRNKKLAKARAAQAALTEIFNLEFMGTPGKLLYLHPTPNIVPFSYRFVILLRFANISYIYIHVTTFMNVDYNYIYIYRKKYSLYIHLWYLAVKVPPLVMVMKYSYYLQ